MTIHYIVLLYNIRFLYTIFIIVGRVRRVYQLCERLKNEIFGGNSVKKKHSYRMIGIGTGIANGLFGAGGGMIAVPSLVKLGKTQHVAQATALAAILPLSAMSAVAYVLKGAIEPVSLWTALGALPGGLLGAWLMPRISAVWLSRIFSALMLAAGIRMLWG